MEKSIIIEDSIGAKELRHLNDLSKLNIALTQDEFLLITMIYQKALDRLVKVAEKQGVEI